MELTSGKCVVLHLVMDKPVQLSDLEAKAFLVGCVSVAIGQRLQGHIVEIKNMSALEYAREKVRQVQQAEQIAAMAGRPPV